MNKIIIALRKSPQLKPLKKIYRLFFPTKDDRTIRIQKRKSQFLINSYFKNNSQKKLYIGCQNQPIEGWLNVDIIPASSAVVFMDATKPFPFSDNSFDFIFSEHMIEHIKLEEGIFMLNECWRVLKPGGVIRIATPDLNFLADLVLKEKSALKNEYILSCKKFFPSLDFINEAMVVNNFMRNWGHQFIYDKATMVYILQKIGFEFTQDCEVGESSFQELKGIEQHGNEIGEQFNKLETFVLQASKKPNL